MIKHLNPTDMTKKLLLAAPLFIASMLTATAQKVEFGGLGRAEVENNQLNDTTSASTDKTTGGKVLMDLGIQVSRGDILRASAILRVVNGFGSFDGDAVDFTFRQLRLEGLIGKKVKYEIGDLDVALTPYTIHFEDDIYNGFESELFGIRRDVVNYEGFVTDEHTRRMQGVNLFTTLNFKSGVESLFLRGFGNRLIGADKTSGQPDRLLFGGRAGLVQSKYFQIGVNAVAIHDIAGSIGSEDYQYRNLVTTTDFRIAYPMGKIDLELTGELGRSQHSDVLGSGTEMDTLDYKDGFMDIGLGADFKDMGLKVRGSYRRVGINYISPAAQSRMFSAFGAMDAEGSLASVNGGTRNYLLYDRFTPTLLNSEISTVLMAYNPAFSNVTPYGVATPNRQGLTLNATYEDKKDRLEAELIYDMLSEIVGVNVAETRQFTSLKGGLALHVNNFIGWKKEVTLHGGVRMESTKRDELSIDLSSNIINAGIDLEVIPRLHLLAGYKMLTAKGNEYLQERDDLNQYPTDGLVVRHDYDFTQGILAAGLKYNFSENTFFNFQVDQFVAGQDESAVPTGETLQDYNITQFYFNYTQKF